MNARQVRSAAPSAPRRNVLSCARRLWLACALGALAPSLAHSQSFDALSHLEVEELKRVYLACGETAIDGRLNRSDIMMCSVVYEALKQRAFDGDFERLLAWSRARRPAQHLQR